MHLESEKNMKICKIWWKNVVTPLLEECEDDTYTSEMGTWESSRIPETWTIARVKTFGLGAFFMSLENYWSENVEIGLAWTIWTSATQVMPKGKVESQTDNLTLNH